jgi:hypothetical protein
MLIEYLRHSSDPTGGDDTRRYITSPKPFPPFLPWPVDQFRADEDRAQTPERSSIFTPPSFLLQIEM